MEAIKFGLLGNPEIEKFLSGQIVIDFIEYATFCVNKYKSRSIKHDKVRKNRYWAYMNAVDHFSRFQKNREMRFNTNEVDAELLEEFSEHLQTFENLMPSTVQGIIRKIRYTLNKACKFNVRVDDSYEDFKMKVYKPAKVTLTEWEVNHLAFFEDLTSRQKEIRDMFILCTQSSLRYSDAERLCRDHINFEKMQINMISKKTKEPLCIPIDDYIWTIINRYDFKCPPARSIQHYNYEIKRIAEKAGFIREIKYEVVRNNKIENIRTRLCDQIASHTARRTFVTQKIRLGWTVTAIRKCTGHTSVCTVEIYDKTDSSKYMQRYSY